MRDLRLQPLEAEVVELVVVLEGGLELGLGLGAHLLAAAGPVVDTIWEKENSIETSHKILISSYNFDYSCSCNQKVVAGY